MIAFPAGIGILKPVVSGNGYPSSVLACWGIKRLNPAYSGNLIRVRRSSDNTEADIGQSGGALDTTALASFVGANSAFIVKMYDQQGSNPLEQATTANQPRIVNAGTYLGYAEFDGSNDRLVANSTLTYGGQAATIFAKLQRAAASGSTVEPMIDVGPSGYTAYAGGYSFYYDPRSNTAVPNYTVGISDGGTPGTGTINSRAFSGSLSTMTTASVVIDTSQPAVASGKSKLWFGGVAVTDAGAAFSLNANVTNNLANQAMSIGGAGSFYSRINFVGCIVCAGDRASERLAAEALF